MHKKYSLCSVIFCAAIGSLFGASLLTAPVSAATEASTILKKVLVNSLQVCYSDTYMNNQVRRTDYELRGLDALIINSDKIILMPTTIENGNIEKDKKISCKNVFDATNNWKVNGTKLGGLYQLYKRPNSIEDLGYVPSTAGSSNNITTSGSACISARYRVLVGDKYSSATPYETDKVCFAVQDGKAVAGDGAYSVTEGSGPITLSYDGQDLHLYARELGNGVFIDLNGYSCGLNNQSWSNIQSRCGDMLSGMLSGTMITDNNGATLSAFQLDSTNINLETDATYIKKNNDPAAAKATAIQFFTNNPNHPHQIGFTKQEYYDWMEMYYQALLQHGINETECGLTKTTATSDTPYAHHSSDGTWCKVIVNDSSLLDKTVSLIKNFGGLLPQKVKISDMLTTMTNWDFNDPDFDDSNAGVNNTVTNTGTERGGDLDTCFTTASSVGWILCPVLQLVGKAADGIYDNIITEWVQVGANEFSNTSNVHASWEIFRDFTNIIFVIILAIIILSQVTGIGVSNYGVKKVLPSLVMVAILVNLSFILCQVAIDLSNIVGDSIYTIFNGLTTTNPNGFSPDFNSILGWLLSAVGIYGIGSFIAGGGAAAAGSAILAAASANIIPIAIAVLAALISLLFVFIVLAVRKAGIIIVVILSPLAIICYALPNTKSFFDKWKKLFVSLLFVFPVCSLLMGGGRFVSSLMLRDDETGFVYNLVALLLQIVPLFFIPSVVRSSLTAAANIGTRISQMGSRINRGITGTLRHSDMAQRLGTTAAYNATGRSERAAAAMARTLRRMHMGGAAKALESMNRHSVAQRRANFLKMQTGDAQDEYAAANLDRDTIQGAILSEQRQQEYAFTDRDIENIRNGNQTYVDENGATQTINAQDPFSLGAALRAALVAADQNPEDAKAQRRVNALSQMLLGKGDKGIDQMSRAAMDYAYSDPSHRNSQSIQKLSQFVGARNDRWNDMIKSKTPGFANFLNDVGSNSVKDQAAYHFAGYDSATDDKIANYGDNYYHNIREAIRNNEFTSSATGKQALQTLDAQFTRMLNNPQLQGRIGREYLDTINSLRLLAYEERQRQYVNDEDAIANALVDPANIGRARDDVEREVRAERARDFLLDTAHGGGVFEDLIRSRNETIRPRP